LSKGKPSISLETQRKPLEIDRCSTFVTSTLPSDTLCK